MATSIRGAIHRLTRNYADPRERINLHPTLFGTPLQLTRADRSHS